MLDLSTLLVLLAAADLALAAGLVVGTGGQLRRGMTFWTGSLLVRGIGCALLASGWEFATGAPALAAALLALAFSFQAAALLAFDRRALPAWVHTAVVAGVAVPVQLLSSEPGMSLHFAALVLGTLAVMAAAIAAQLQHPTPARLKKLLVGTFSVAAAVFYLRAIGGLFLLDPMQPVLAPTSGQSFAFALLFATTILSTFGFLALHKERADAEAQKLSTLDPLTGSYNRRTFHEIAERELARARRAGTPLSIIMVDIDHFRAVNEKFGHKEGDDVLRWFAERVRAALRQEDMLVRFGGEEFVVLLPEVPGPGAVVVAGRIRRMVSADPVMVNGTPVEITASLGVAARLDEGPESMDTLIARADAALSMAKDRGRNRVVALSLGRSIAA